MHRQSHSPLDRAGLQNLLDRRREALESKLVAADIGCHRNRRLGPVQGELAVDIARIRSEREGVERENTVAQDEMRRHPVERQRLVANPLAGKSNVGVRRVQLVETIFAVGKNAPWRVHGLRISRADKARKIANVEKLRPEISAHQRLRGAPIDDEIAGEIAVTDSSDETLVAPPAVVVLQMPGELVFG